MTTACQPPHASAAAPALPRFVLARTHALLGAEWGVLSGLLDEALCYVHATGRRHDKPQYLQFVREQIRVLSLDIEAPRVQWMGEVAVVTGLLRQTIVRQGEHSPVALQSWVTEVWRQSDHWRLCAFQSTRAEFG